MEEYTVKITREAREQLHEIVRYIAFKFQEPNTALRLLDVLEKEIASLSKFPGRVKLTEEEPWRSQGIHKMAVKNYLVYFWIDEPARKVQVTAVIYGGRDQIKQLSKMVLE